MNSLNLQEMSWLGVNDPMFHHLEKVDKLNIDWSEINIGLDEFLENHNDLKTYLDSKKEFETSEFFDKLKRIFKEDRHAELIVSFYVIANLDYFKEEYLKIKRSKIRNIASTWKPSQEIP